MGVHSTDRWKTGYFVEKIGEVKLGRFLLDISAKQHSLND